MLKWRQKDRREVPEEEGLVHVELKLAEMLNNDLYFRLINLC